MQTEWFQKIYLEDGLSTEEGELSISLGFLRRLLNAER